MLFKSGVNLSDSIKTFIKGSKELYIFVPYIKIDTLREIIGDSSACKLIVVRWETKDLLLGSSDLEIFEYCRMKNITLYRNPRLHLKAFVDNFKSCLLGSANISSRALNIPANDNYNYELAISTNNLSIFDRLYFTIILNESILITDKIYDRLRVQLLEKKEQNSIENEFDFKVEYPDKDFLISALPMTKDIDTFERFYLLKEPVSEVEENCAIHDLALFNLTFGLGIEDLRIQLKASFFNHPFIKAFLKNMEINKEIYFGAAKDWIHKNCSNVPTPRRSEITENIQILFKWIVDLGDGKYKIDVPGTYSERLSIV